MSMLSVSNTESIDFIFVCATQKGLQIRRGLNMAKLPALISALAQVDGRERKAIDHIGRTIRERGYITTGKRGHGAAEMTTSEVVNLIIALNGADTPKDAPLAIDRFRSLRQAFQGSRYDMRKRVDAYESYPRPIQDVMDSSTFGEALEVLVDGIPELVASLYRYMVEAYTDLEPEKFERVFSYFLRLRLFGLSITFQRYQAKIELYRMVKDSRHVDFEAEFIQDEDRLETGFYGQGEADRHVVVNIGTATLIAAWQVLHPGETLHGVADLIVGSDPEEEAQE
jgi:hypothetical protein